MSSRSCDQDEGSSRSARDYSRSYREDRSGGSSRNRSRSRSPRQRQSLESRSQRPKSKADSDPRYSSHDKNRDYKSSKDSGNEEDAPLPPPPPPPRITKISIGFSKPKSSKASVASVFNNEEDDEPEEMPAEARMRMRNIGRETPTSAGPNSFGKTKQGFCDSKKVFEKNLKNALETADKSPTLLTKFPQTIYKLKGP